MSVIEGFHCICKWQHRNVTIGYKESSTIYTLCEYLEMCFILAYLHQYTNIRSSMHFALMPIYIPEQQQVQSLFAGNPCSLYPLPPSTSQLVHSGPIFYMERNIYFQYYPSSDLKVLKFIMQITCCHSQIIGVKLTLADIWWKSWLKFCVLCACENTCI